MKKLMYLAITFFTFIFSFVAPIKNNFKININNNKIVEKLEPKRAFENAPKKETSLPGFNKEFKIFFNISSLQDLNNFYNTLDFSNEENIYFIGTDSEENQSIQFYYIWTNQVNYKFTVTAVYFQDSNSINPVTLFEFSKINDTFNYSSAVGGNNGELTTDTVVNEIFTGINETISSLKFLSLKEIQPHGIPGVLKVNKAINSDYVYGYDLRNITIFGGLIDTISSIATGLLSLLISLFSSVVAIFWNVSNNTPTFLGVVTLFIVAVPITYWVINFVIGLIKKIRLTRGK